ncbi:MAG: prolyl oligopeptidase family serine peptidase [Pirellulaceae bacterium]
MPRSISESMVPSSLKRSILIALLTLWAVTTHAVADGLQDNDPEKVRRIPKLGIKVSTEQRRMLEAGMTRLARSVAKLRQSEDQRTLMLLPDVEIFHRAVSDALGYQEFFAAREIQAAVRLLETGQKRADNLATGKAPWTVSTGLVVRGYVSKIDGSVQPYGVVIPETYDRNSVLPYRLDVWFHGRGETLSEVNFLTQRQRQAGTFTPRDGIVLHPYGRYSNANKFAGEIDVLEAVAAVKRHYLIDDERVSVRGFSMGGASTWQLAVHYPTRWVAANPGAGFSETPLFLRSFQQETLTPPWYEERLWRMHDCNLWARNLGLCPTVAYSGELDRQKQAADVMAYALTAEGIQLTHVIGPGTAHKYHPAARDEVERRVTALARRGRRRVPNTIRFVTYTLRYNEAGWITVNGLLEHWERASVNATLDRSNAKIEIITENIDAVSVHFDPGDYPFDPQKPLRILINGQEQLAVQPNSDLSYFASYVNAGDWTLGGHSNDQLRKRSGLQGPIDDALMDSFIFVRPTGPATHPRVAGWARSELDRAIEHWRRHFRGHARVVNDVDITDDQIANSNLILWGEPSSNSIWNRIQADLPIQHVGKDLIVPGRGKFPAELHAPILIYPNPLNADRYVVINSSFTFREYSYLNNARQTAKLPDWAIVDLRTPPGTQWPGKIVDAGFFDETWRVKRER